MPGPLDGIRIVDISAILSGPLATMMLQHEHTDEVLAELGYDDETRAALRADGVIV